MAVTRREYIFGVFVLSFVSVVLILMSISSDRWVVSSATAIIQYQDSTIHYGLFGGVLLMYIFPTPTVNILHMTCVSSVSACAVSCKTEEDARKIEVEALANGYRPSESCVAQTDVDMSNPLEVPPVIPFAFYVCLLLVIFLQLLFAMIAAGLAITNAIWNPTEPIFGLLGCLWSNVVTAVIGLATLLMFGVYWATSGLQDHLAITYVAVGFFQPFLPRLGYSFWVLLGSMLCNVCNVALILFRAYILERDPSPPVVKVENHSNITSIMF